MTVVATSCQIIELLTNVFSQMYDVTSTVVGVLSVCQLVTSCIVMVYTV